MVATLCACSRGQPAPVAQADLPTFPVPNPSATVPPPTPLLSETEVTSTLPGAITTTPTLLFTTPITTLVITPGNSIACQVTPPGWWLPYTVRGGDTVGRLAQTTNTTIAEIQRVNCLPDPNRIFIGQILYLPPFPAVTPIPSLPATALTETVTIKLTAIPTIPGAAPGPGTPQPDSPTVSVNPSAGSITTTFHIYVQHFPVSQTVTLEIWSEDGNEPIVTMTLSVSAQGEASYTFNPPAAMSPGLYLVTVDAGDGLLKETQLTIQK
ncbi:MAG: LysM peptidoglycan-binding domain-containing protein [Chloroflexi bacterium]|nr:LysM peptidoglycan-binding domain-containing protein [Chloroflexota bacterium]